MDEARHPPPPPRLVPHRPLPPYRYLPGRGPHPLRHPEGHLHGKEPPPPPPLDPERWWQSEDWLYACDLFNRHYYWEAHESWEGLWHRAHRDSPTASALQGLIQAAAACIKDELGQHQAADRLARSARARLLRAAAATSGPRFLGLDLPTFIHHLEHHRHDPQHTPFPHLHPQR